MQVNPLKTRRALITGASEGIGEAFAREFASHGFDLVLVARRESKLESVARSIKEQHDVDIRLCPCDLLATDAAEKLFENCADLEIDVLVNNAGIMYHGEFKGQDIDSIDRVVQLNISSLTKLTRLFLQPMLSRGSGRIMNVTSTGGFQAAPTMAVYGASKGYILFLTEALSEELRGSGVSATAFCPGSTNTHMLEESFGEGTRKGFLNAVFMMNPEEVAQYGYKACMDGDAIALPGFVNNLVTFLNRLQPRWFNRRMRAIVYKKFIEDQ